MTKLVPMTKEHTIRNLKTLNLKSQNPSLPKAQPETPTLNPILRSTRSTPQNTSAKGLKHPHHIRNSYYKYRHPTSAVIATPQDPFSGRSVGTPPRRAHTQPAVRLLRLGG